MVFPISVQSAKFSSYRNSEIHLVVQASTLYLRKSKNGFDIDFRSKKGEQRIYQEANLRYINQKFQIGKKVYLVQVLQDLGLHSKHRKIRLSVFTPQTRFADETLLQKLCKIGNPPATRNLIEFSEAIKTSNYAKVFDQKTCVEHDTTAYGKIFSESANSIIETAENCSEGFLQKTDPTLPEWAYRFVGFYKVAIQSVIKKIDEGKGDLKVVCAESNSPSPSKEVSSISLSVSSNSVGLPTYEIHLAANGLQPEDDDVASAQAETNFFKIIQHELKHLGLPFEPIQNQNKCEHKLFTALENMCKGHSPKVFLDSVIKDCRPVTGGSGVAGPVDDLSAATDAANTPGLTRPNPDQETPRTPNNAVAANQEGARLGNDKDFTTVATAQNSANAASAGATRAPTVADGGTQSQTSQSGYARAVKPGEYPAIDRSVRENLPAAVEAASNVQDSIFGGPSNSSSRGDSDTSGNTRRSRSDETTSVQGMAAQLLAGNSAFGGAPTAAQTNLSNQIAGRLDSVGATLTAAAESLVPAAQAAELGPNQVFSIQATVQPNGQIIVEKGGDIADHAARDWVGLGGAFDPGSGSGISTLASASAGPGKSGVAKADGFPASRVVAGISAAPSAFRKIAKSVSVSRPARTLAGSAASDAGPGASTTDDTDSTQEEEEGYSNKSNNSKNNSVIAAKTETKLSSDQKIQIASLVSISELSGPRYDKLRSQYKNPIFQKELRNQGICIQYTSSFGEERIGASEQCQKERDSVSGSRKPASNGAQDAQILMRNLQNRRRDGSTGTIILRDNGKRLERVQ